MKSIRSIQIKQIGGRKIHYCASRTVIGNKGQRVAPSRDDEWATERQCARRNRKWVKQISNQPAGADTGVAFGSLYMFATLTELQNTDFKGLIN